MTLEVFRIIVVESLIRIPIGERNVHSLGPVTAGCPDSTAPPFRLLLNAPAFSSIAHQTAQNASRGGVTKTWVVALFHARGNSKRVCNGLLIHGM
jgi:hypothetical protein